MDVGVVGEQAFLRRVEEVRAVVDGGLLRGRAAEDFGLPGIAGGGRKEGVSWEFGNGDLGMKGGFTGGCQSGSRSRDRILGLCCAEGAA